MAAERHLMQRTAKSSGEAHNQARCNKVALCSTEHSTGTTHDSPSNPATIERISAFAPLFFADIALRIPSNNLTNLSSIAFLVDRINQRPFTNSPRAVPPHIFPKNRPTALHPIHQHRRDPVCTRPRSRCGCRVAFAQVSRARTRRVFVSNRLHE
jgi:hypothetical protein